MKSHSMPFEVMVRWPRHSRYEYLGYANKQPASYVLCADGGANRYYELMKSRGRENTDVRPTDNQSKPVINQVC